MDMGVTANSGIFVLNGIGNVLANAALRRYRAV
jgi:hypothetical protein